MQVEWLALFLMFPGLKGEPFTLKEIVFKQSSVLKLLQQQEKIYVKKKDVFSAFLSPLDT